MGSQWDQCGISVGSVWDQCGISVGAVWDQCGISVGSVWGQCVSGVSAVWDQCGIGVGSDQCGVNVGSIMWDQCVYQCVCVSAVWDRRCVWIHNLINVNRAYCPMQYSKLINLAFYRSVLSTRRCLYISEERICSQRRRRAWEAKQAYPVPPCAVPVRARIQFGDVVQGSCRLAPRDG